MANEGDPSQLIDMSLEQAHKMRGEIAILKLQDQLSRLTKPLAQVNEVMREPAYFEGSLDPNRYLKWVQTLENYFEAKGYSTEESFIIAIEKLQGTSHSSFRNLIRE